MLDIHEFNWVLPKRIVSGDLTALLANRDGVYFQRYAPLDEFLVTYHVLAGPAKLVSVCVRLHAEDIFVAGPTMQLENLLRTKVINALRLAGL